jgi:hypothetical protein
MKRQASIIDVIMPSRLTARPSIVLVSRLQEPKLSGPAVPMNPLTSANPKIKDE